MDNAQSNNTVFDDVFRTMVEKMPELIIPVVNEVFHTSYDESEEIIQYRNEQHTKQGEIITDSIFKIGGHLYHVECQSRPDSTMVIRMIEYDFAAALERIHPEDGILELDFPDSCVLYLRHTSQTPDTLQLKVNFPGSSSVMYSVPVIKVQEYTKDEIFRKKLLMFLPFYMLRYEKSIKKMNDDPDNKDELLEDMLSEYADILKKLNDLYSGEDQSALYTDLVELMIRISDYLLAKNKEAKERMDDLMGGKVLELRSERLRREGRQEGMQEGRQEGMQEGMNLSACIYRLVIDNPKWSDEQVAKAADCEVEKVKAVKKMFRL